MTDEDIINLLDIEPIINARYNHLLYAITDWNNEVINVDDYLIQVKTYLNINEITSEVLKSKVKSFTINNSEDINYGIKQQYLEKNLSTFRRMKKASNNKYLVKHNNSASVYYYEPKDYNIVEFTTKANALDPDSMEMLKFASDKNLIIINDSMQFSAGVNLNMLWIM